jgi:hypothetical protein
VIDSRCLTVPNSISVCAMASSLVKRCTRGVAVAGLILLCGCAQSQIDELFEIAGLGTQGALSESTVIAGLREALRVGTQRSVAVTSQQNGYFDNPLIRIALPDELDATAKALRALGFGAKVDELELAMNRAAERAAGEATPVFLDAITSMSIQDAHGILRGGDRAATDYFETRTRGTLTQRFEPIVDESMRKVGLVQLWDALLARIAILPLVPKPDFDLNTYVTDRGLTGLFMVLAQEETRIREDPAARTTELLRNVFGRAD